jgi:hypothetical protein
MKMGVEEAISVEAPMKMEGKERVFVVLGDEDEVWESEEPKPESPPRRMEMEVGKKVDVWKDARTRGTGAGGLEEMEPDDEPHWMTVSQYRIHWDERWSTYYGSFEDSSKFFSIN